MGSVSSINFKPVKANSTRHNERIGELDYVYSDLSKDNESWKIDEITNRYQAISDLTKEKTGRKIQAKATPIREAVVNLQPHHSMKDLQRLSSVLKEEKGINAFQIHIHKDEGKSREELNYHAHIVFDWQNKETGKSFKLNRQDMSQIQDIAARELGMDRGELKENSNRERLEAIEYKRSKEEEKVGLLQDEMKVLEQKKNRAEIGYYEVAKQIPGSDDFIDVLAWEDPEDNSGFQLASKEELEKTYNLQLGNIKSFEKDIIEARSDVLEIEQEYAEFQRIERELPEVQRRIKDEETNILRLRIAIAEAEKQQNSK